MMGTRQDMDRAPDEDMANLLQMLANSDEGDHSDIDTMLMKFPDDARLHFLKGSTLAGNGRALEAHRSLSRAVEIAPDFAIARFQLGFFELTSGEAGIALETWAPLDTLDGRHYLRYFVEGLRALIADHFADCITALEAGIAVNQENIPLNNDMKLIIDQCSDLVKGAEGDPGEGAMSATALLLHQFDPTTKAN